MKSNRGLTLIELITVLAVVSIIMAVTAVSALSADRRVLNNASLQLQADLRHAQRMAMIEGREWALVISSDSYRIARQEPPSGIMQSEKTVNLEDGVRFSDAKFSGDNLLNVVYFPRGTISEGFTATLQKGRYYQQLTATVSGGRIKIGEIKYN